MAPGRLILGTSTTTRGTVFDPLWLSISAISSQCFPRNERCQTFLASTLSAFCISSRGLVISSLNFNLSRIALHAPPFKASRSDIWPYGHRLLCRALRTSGETEIQSDDGSNPSLLQRPAYVPKQGIVEGPELDESLHDHGHDHNENQAGDSDEAQSVAQWIDWEDEILQDTRPLVGFARMILHSNRYQNGKRLSPEDEKVILDKLLPYHPNIEEKIGCGVDFIMMMYGRDVEGDAAEAGEWSSLSAVPGICWSSHADRKMNSERHNGAAWVDRIRTFTQRALTGADRQHFQGIYD